MDFSVVTEQLPAISAKIGVEESQLSALLSGAGPAVMPVAPGPHYPGVLLSAAFDVVGTSFLGLLDSGIVEKMRAGSTLVPVSITFEGNDVAGGAQVGAAGARVQGPGNMGG